MDNNDNGSTIEEPSSTMVTSSNTMSSEKKVSRLMEKLSSSGSDLLYKASILTEALPYLKKFSGETFVIKYGGSTLGSGEVMECFAKDVSLLKYIGINPIVVHGGGPQITQMLDKLGIKTSFVDGVRVTDKETAEIAEMVLVGSINKKIVHAINKAGGMAIGMSGKDGSLIKARKLRRVERDPNSNIERIIDLGLVGEPELINIEALAVFEETMAIPVIAPVGYGENDDTFNINADTVAGSIAGAISASKLIMLTDVDGILDKDGNLITEISIKQAKEYIANGTISGGMIPKVETCINALESGVTYVHILNGNVNHVLLIEVFTKEGVGTMIYNEDLI